MNFSTVISLVNTAINSCFSWFNTMLSATGAYYYVLAGIITMLIFRFLVFPLVAGRKVTVDFKKKASDE